MFISTCPVCPALRRRTARNRSYFFTVCPPSAFVFADAGFSVILRRELFVEVRAVGSQTKVQNILSMIDNSQALKVSSQVRSERLADSLVKYNFLLSLAVFLFTRNMTKVMATLIISFL